MKRLHFIYLMLLHLLVLVIFIGGAIKIIITGAIAGGVIMAILGAITGTSATMLVIEYVKGDEE